MVLWYTQFFWIFKVSGLNYFFLLKLWLYPFRSCPWNRKKKITDDAAKCVFLTVHAHPSPEVFRSSIGKWGGSFAEVFFIKCREKKLTKAQAKPSPRISCGWLVVWVPKEVCGHRVRTTCLGKDERSKPCLFLRSLKIGCPQMSKRSKINHRYLTF